MNLSEFESSSSEMSRKRLTEVIGTHNIRAIVYENEEENEDKDEDEDEDSLDSEEINPTNNKTMNWYNTLKKAVLNSTYDHRGKEKENLYYFPGFEFFFSKTYI